MLDLVVPLMLTGQPAVSFIHSDLVRWAIVLMYLLLAQPLCIAYLLLHCR